MSEPRWPDGAAQADLDPVAAELGRALAEARAREPDDVTLRRMWARVSQPELQMPAPAAHPPRWLWFAGGVATTAALAVGATLWLLPRLDAKRAPIVAAHAAPMNETRLTPATEGTVRTGAGERLNLSLAGGTEARLEASTVMRIDRGGRASVDGGEVSFSVPHPRTGHSYVVFAGPYRVVLAGSKFRLRLDDTRRVFIEAQEGRVEVWDRARLASLSPGESWASPATPETGPMPADAPVRVHVHPPAVPAASSKGDEAGAAAQAALAAGDVPKALGLYRALAKSGGPAGENASYEVGKILRDRLSQPAAAVAAWRRYRTDHPSGVLRVEADVSIIETLVHGGDVAGALAEANDFVRNHPDSERRAEIARVAGDLYRTRADYKRAVAAYQIALASPQLRDAAEPASFHRAECLVRLGDPNGTEAARAYLRRWPNGRFRTEAERLLESGDDTGATRL